MRMFSGISKAIVLAALNTGALNEAKQVKVQPPTSEGALTNL